MKKMAWIELSHLGLNGLACQELCVTKECV